MKQKIYILGIITILVIFLGALFKINHWPAAGIMLTIGIATLVFAFLPLAIADHYKASDKKYPGLHFVTWLTCFVVFTAMLFKLMHWPFAGIALVIALPFPYLVFLPVFLISTSRDKDFNINNLVAVLILLAVNSVFSGFLALNVSKEMITDSYNLSGNYITMESQVKGLPAQCPSTEINLRIDETVKVINEYQDAILKADGNSLEKWMSDPGNLARPDAKGIPVTALANAGEEQLGSRLAASFSNLIKEVSADNNYKILAEVLPEILGFKVEDGYVQSWAPATFNDTSLIWVLIYLEGVKVDLLTLKASLL